MFPYNGGYNYTIPACLKPGYYLVRHEIVALHSAWAMNGAQFYPSCHQLNVSGAGNVVPTNLVSFPGAYRADDPGIFINVWNRRYPYYDPEAAGVQHSLTCQCLAGTYSIPGPEVFKCP